MSDTLDSIHSDAQCMGVGTGPADPQQLPNNNLTNKNFYINLRVREMNPGHFFSVAIVVFCWA